MSLDPTKLDATASATLDRARGIDIWRDEAGDGHQQHCAVIGQRAAELKCSVPELPVQGRLFHASNPLVRVSEGSCKLVVRTPEWRLSGSSCHWPLKCFGHVSGGPTRGSSLEITSRDSTVPPERQMERGYIVVRVAMEPWSGVTWV